MICSAQERGHRLTAIPAAEVADALSPEGYRPQLVEHCLRVYGREVEPGTWCLDATKVCVGVYFCVHAKVYNKNNIACVYGRAVEPTQGQGHTRTWCLDATKVCLQCMFKMYM
jgi:hypothetical protein